MGTLATLVGAALHRVKNLARRGVVRSSDDAHKALELEVAILAKETSRGVERFAHYGFTSRPKAGAEVVVISIGGERAHPIVVADEDRRERPTGALADGEVAIYAAGGARVFLRADGSVEIEAPGGVRINGGVEVTGDLEASGDLADAIGTLDALRQAYNVHVHADPQGGTTGPPVPTVP